MIGAALVAVGAIAAFAIKRSPQSQHFAVATEVGYVTACACASCWCAPPGDTSDTEAEARCRRQVSRPASRLESLVDQE